MIALSCSGPRPALREPFSPYQNISFAARDVERREVKSGMESESWDGHRSARLRSCPLILEPQNRHDRNRALLPSRLLNGGKVEMRPEWMEAKRFFLKLYVCIWVF